MLAYLVIGILVVLPLLLGVFLRVPTSHLFFSLMAGELLARYFHREAALVVSETFNSTAAGGYAEVGILLFPLILTALFLRHTLPKNKLLLHIVPLLIMGVILCAFALPAFPPEVEYQIRGVEIGRQLMETSDLIIGSVVLLQLVVLWLLNGLKPHKHH